MKFFTIEELCKSETADKYGIDNTPSPEIVSHLEELGILLDRIRKDWGSPIRVTSGYRCPELNKKVRGKDTSAHLYGYAADIQPLHPSEFDAFCESVKRSVSGSKYDLQSSPKWDLQSSPKWDQVIIEKNSRGSRWVHIGVRRGDGSQRKMIFGMEVE